MTALRALTLQRLEQNDYATYGHLIDEEQRIICCTLELPWRGNIENRSCVPSGRTYNVDKYDSPKHRRIVPRLLGVPNRSDCEMHIANLAEELLGCIALGRAFGTVTNKAGITGHGVTDSGSAFDAFMAAYPEPLFTLTILDPVSPATSIVSPIGVAA